LVAVVLSAQTTDVQVNKVTPALFKRAKTPKQMAAMSEGEILSLIRSCGLAPSKAKNLKRLAEQLIDDYGGKVPRDIDELEKLPGVGHKTASVVMTQAFGEPAFPVDTHIHRLAKRWRLSNGKDVKQTEADLKKLFPREEWGRRHLQIIYFGREYCPARNHDEDACPICSWAARK
jgi:endonuclease-3